MENHNEILDGFKILNSIDLEEVDRRIAWLEEALAIYRTLRAVKEVHSRQMVAAPEEWKSAVDLDREDQEERMTGQLQTRSAYGELKVIVRKMLKANRYGLTARDLAKLLNKSRATINAHLHKHKGHYYTKLHDGHWILVELPTLQNEDSAAQTEEKVVG